MYRRILVATDGSKLSKKAEQAGIDLALATGATLVAFSAAAKVNRPFMRPAAGGGKIDATRVEAYWIEYARDTAEKLRDRARDRGVDAKAVSVLVQRVADAIIDQARKQKCDLIVMASHGRRGMERLLLGSETQHVLVHSGLPVLVVR